MWNRLDYEKMAITLQGMGDDVIAYGKLLHEMLTGARLCSEMGIANSFLLTSTMLQDEHIDLVYIATPHSHHYEHAKMCLLKGKAVLCEKAFTANAAQAEELLNLAR